MIAAHLGAAAVLASPLPGFTPTAAFPSALVPWKSLGPFNRLTHTLTARASEWMHGKLLRQWRHEVLGDGAPVRRPGSAGTLYAYSPSVVPVPPEWGQDVRVTGYWFLDEPAGWQPSPQLAQFLQAGPPPAYLGFGSMPIAQPQEFTRMVVQAVQQAGCRAVLAAGWGGLGAGELPRQVHLLDTAPHDRLFPAMAAVVHHGGAGTTAAGLRAGKPTVICPFLGDQPFWGHRVAALGAGPPPLAAPSLRADTLAAALTRALNERRWRDNAQRLAADIAGEDGIGAAVNFIQRLGPRPNP
jgi:sterol 3beta-glucosyltransferase